MSPAATRATNDVGGLEIEIDLDAEVPTALRFAGYEVLGRIAVGGMAEVFMARERGEGGSARLVALKVIRAHLAANAELAEMFLQEGRVALGLTHPNLCHTLRFGTEHGHPFLAMELVSGITLRDVFGHARRAGTSLSASVVAKIVATVAEALHSAHVATDDRARALGIVHQDVSPQNVMIGYDGTVKLLDFGVASTSRERASDVVEHSHVTVRGKTAYLSPEQCSGVPLDARSDVFSLGIVLYELLTSTRLFARGRGEESMRAIVAEPLPVWPETIPDALRSVLTRALAHDRDDRYATASAMQEDLERFLADERCVVTSHAIARELRALLGEHFGRGPSVDASAEAIAWLRSEAETQCLPIPLDRRERPRLRAAIGLVALVAVVATTAMLALRGMPVPTSSVVASPVPTSISASPSSASPPTSTSPPTSVSISVSPAPSPPIATPAPRPRGRGRRAPTTTTAADEPPTDILDDPGY